MEIFDIEKLISTSYHIFHMETTIEHLSKDIACLRRDVELIKHMLEENYELSEEGKEALARARETPESEYIDLDEL